MDATGSAYRAREGDGDVVGVVFGNVTTTEFRLAVRDPALRRLDYVQVDHPTDGQLVAHVVEVTRETGLSFEDVDRLGYAEGAPRRDHLVARARVVGFRDQRGLLQAPRTPVPAGAAVRRVDTQLLAHVFGLRDEEGAYLGLVKGYDLRVVLDINTLVQKHVSVLAKTGSGKSYAVGVLMEELIKKGVPIVVIDPHGEHASLARPNHAAHEQAARRRFGVTPRNYGESIVEYAPDALAVPDAVPFRLEATSLEAREIAELLGKMSSSQMGLLHAAVRALQDAGEEYGLQDVLQQVREAASNAKWNVVSALETLVAMDLFQAPGTSVESLVQPKKVSILNLKGATPDVQSMVVAITARRLFEARKVGRIPPFMLVVEEAHNFAPEKGMSTTSTGEILRTVASEGRKFGMGLTVVSQRPAKVDKNVLSQCNTQIILKVTNPNDLKALAASVEGFSSESEDEIQRLPVGVAFVSHPRISLPVLVEIRPRETSHGGESVDVMASVRDDAQPARAEPEPEEPDEEETAPEEPPKPRPRARPTPREAPRPVPAAPQRLPEWIEDCAEEEALLARADLAALQDGTLRRLEDELTEKVRRLARAAAEWGAEVRPLLARHDAHLVRVQALVRARGEEARRLRGRLRAWLAARAADGEPEEST